MSCHWRVILGLALESAGLEFENVGDGRRRAAGAGRDDFDVKVAWVLEKAIYYLLHPYMTFLTIAML